MEILILNIMRSNSTVHAFHCNGIFQYLLYYLLPVKEVEYAVENMGPSHHKSLIYTTIQDATHETKGIT